jgi:hypothetical protein
MGPFTAPAIGGSAAGISEDVNNLAPLATVYHGADTGVSTNQVVKASSYTAAPSNANAFFSKVGSVFKESGHMFMGATDWVGKQLYQGGKDAVTFLPDLAKETVTSYQDMQANFKQNSLQTQYSQLLSDYKDNKIDENQFNEQLKSIQDSYKQTTNQFQTLLAKERSENNTAIKSSIGFASDVATVVTGGLTSLAKVGVDEGVQAAAKFMTSSLADAALSPAEEAVTKLAASKALLDALPDSVQAAVKDSVTNTFVNAGKGLTGAQIARATVSNLALKYPLAFNYLSGTGDQVYKELQSDKYGSAAKTLGFNAALLLSGGPIGQAMKYGGKALRSVGGAIFGSTSFLDMLSTAAGYKPNDIYQAIKDDPELVKGFQALEATNMAAEDGRVGSAVYRVVNGLKADSPDIFGDNPKEFVQNVQNWASAQKDLTDTMTSRVGAGEARKYVVGRWAPSTQNWVATQLTKPYLDGVTQFSSEKALSDWEDIKSANPNAAYSNNENLDKQVKNIISNSSGPEDLYSNITEIKAAAEQGVPKALASRLASKGYLAIAPSKLEAPFVEGTQKLTTKFGETDDFFTKAVQPLPVLKEFGSVLTRFGLSPERADQATYEIFNENFAKNLQDTSLMGGFKGEDATIQADTISKRLSDYVNNVNKSRYNFNHPPITDLRQLTQKEVVEALNVTKAQAKEVSEAAMQSMLDVSLAQRGLGDKLTDYAMSIRAGKKISLGGYLRVQGAGRFAWNPFFKMKAAAKTEFLTQMETGGKWPPSNAVDKMLGMVFQGRYGDLQDTADLLERQGFFTSGFSNEAANEAAAGAGALKANNLLNSQKKSIAGLVASQAEHAGMNVQTFVDNYPNETRDTIEAILHYDPKGNFINSPMARTLNFAFFPARFNIKVGTFMAKTIARQSALVQVATIHGLMQAHNFLTSQEGQAWYSQNSDALGLLTYFSPLETLSAISALGHIGHESVGSLGELGGLPAGFIVQILQAEGMIGGAPAYVNPQTGEVGTNYIPVTSRAKIATAISSFLGSLFTYPGSEAGLPSKTGLVTKVGEGITGTSSSEWDKVPQTNLTPQQQQFAQAVQALQAKHQNFVPADPEDSTPAVNVPAQSSPATTPIPKTSGAKATKLKKGQFIPQLLPGQTQLGQL